MMVEPDIDGGGGLQSSSSNEPADDSRGGPPHQNPPPGNTITQAVMLPPDFFFESWHHYDTDEFCPQEQEKAALEALRQAEEEGVDEMHLRRQKEQHERTKRGEQEPMIALKVPFPAGGRASKYPRITYSLPTGHNYKKEDVASMRAVHSLYTAFRQDTSFCHKYRIIGSALHPKYPGTLLVLVHGEDEHYVPEYWPEHVNHGDMEICQETYNKHPVDKNFLRLEIFFEHDAQIMIDNCLSHGKGIPPRYLWMHRVLTLRRALPTHQEQVANVGKALLRLALAVGDLGFATTQHRVFFFISNLSCTFCMI
ncbi:unnamed protein product [Amoebophrya sp. A120]|nr:unnamed protein product [Amoebophrya sp. A120]|eukprot:GSA120T00023089001.1